MFTGELLYAITAFAARWARTAAINAGFARVYFAVVVTKRVIAGHHRRIHTLIYPAFVRGTGVIVIAVGVFIANTIFTVPNRFIRAAMAVSRVGRWPITLAAR